MDMILALSSSSGGGVATVEADLASLFPKKFTIDGEATAASEEEEDRPRPFSFSACLLMKDSNVILPEWLAYHYTVLPLRRLIVAVDPLSHMDPRPILDAYGSIGMNITVWMDEAAYWNASAIPHQNFSDYHELVHGRYKDNADPHGDYVKLKQHQNRQKFFVEACLRTLRDEGRDWTIHLDVDEYLAFNYHDKHEGLPSHCKGNTTCERDYARAIEDGTHYRARLDESSTAAEHIDRHHDGEFDNPDKPCVMIARFLFVSKECDPEENDIQRGLIDDDDDDGGGGFNASMFHTLRYRYRTLHPQRNGKSIIDVSRYDGRHVLNPHRLLGKLCTG